MFVYSYCEKRERYLIAVDDSNYRKLMIEKSHRNGTGSII